MKIKTPVSEILRRLKNALIFKGLIPLLLIGLTIIIGTCILVK